MIQESLIKDFHILFDSNCNKNDAKKVYSS